MRKFSLVFVLLLSIIAISSADLVQIPNGDHTFKTTDDKTIGLITNDSNMVLISEGGTATLLKLYSAFNPEIDKTKEIYFYKTDEGDIVLIFDDNCNGFLLTSKEKKYIHDVSCNEETKKDEETKEQK